MIEENKSSMKNSVRRLVIAGIGVLIQIIWVVVLVMRLNQYSQIITLLTVAIELVLVLAVYSMDTNAAFKLPAQYSDTFSHIRPQFLLYGLLIRHPRSKSLPHHHPEAALPCSGPSMPLNYSLELLLLKVSS